MKKLIALIALSFLCAIFLSYAGNDIGGSQNEKPALMTQQTVGKKAYDFTTILVKFKQETTKEQRKDIASLAQGKFKDKNEDGIDDRYQNILGGRLAAIKLQGEKGVDLASRALSALQHHPFIEYAEYNYLHFIDATPNETRFDELWGLHNTGQTGGTPDADIDAPEAWEISTGSPEIVVGVIDTGIDYDHPDLKNNIWINHNEIDGNGIDDDGNGYVDDYHGINAIPETGNGNPYDDNGHGTHCAGTIGAVGNNNIGVVGVNWKVRLVGMKFLNFFGSGSTDDAIECIDYAIALKNSGVNIRVLSNSWGGGGSSSALYEAIDAAKENNILFVAAAGNSSADNDLSPFYPASYEVPNVLAVAATDHNDNLSSFSNYGATTVDIGAPGSSILSTTPNNTYSTMSGTSMATPHISGAAALLLSVNDDLTFGELKNYLMDHGDPIPALAGKCVSGNRLNVHASLVQIPPPGPTFRLSVDPTSQTIKQGEQASYDIHIESVMNFQEPIQLAANSDLPMNSITFTPNPGNPGSISQMEVTTTDVDPGSYTILVTGTSASIDDKPPIPVTLEVNPENMTTVSYTNNQEIAIPDWNPDGITSTIYVPDSLSVWNTGCFIEITHPYIGDLTIKLISPAGTVYTIRDRVGGSADFPPDGILSTTTQFRNELGQGTWTLFVSDTGPFDIGTLESWTLTIDGVPIGPPNQAPTVTIMAPDDGSSFAERSAVYFEGTATDYEDGDISAYIQWHSSINGSIGTGSPFSTSSLSVGTHVITATAEDLGGNSGSDSITITVTVNQSVCNDDGTCEAGEDCNSCPDCIGGNVTQTCDVCFKGDCDGKCNSAQEGLYCKDCSPKYCCGDGICEGPENSGNCSVDCSSPSCGDGICDSSENQCICSADCGTPPGTEVNHCSDGVDNDCDGLTDGDDQEDCPSSCRGKNAPCTQDNECCSGDCKPNGTCRG